MKKIVLFIPYYLSESYYRQAELDICLKSNVDVAEIDKIFLLVDDGHVPENTNSKITIIHTQKRPSYSDWITLTKEHCNGEISVLANSDIYFDDSIAKMREVFDTSGHALIALSRYEVVGDTIELHKNPHWSQDVWAIDSANPVTKQIHDKLNIPLGVPRCDNKICYIFSVHGYDVHNPCNFIKSYHVHETQVRGYDMHVDKRILGGTAWISPSESITTPSVLDYDIWTLKPSAVKNTKINPTIVRKEAQGLGGGKAKPISKMIVAYDNSWQYPAITEQYAYTMISKRLDASFHNDTSRYFAFPWATLIDNLLHNKKTPAKTDFLQKKLFSFKPKLTAKRIITTCQHIHMLKFQDLFNDMGITDIYWSHAQTTQNVLPKYSHIKIHPFPLYPVQAAGADLTKNSHRDILYSFVGAKANKFYLTDSRNIIIDGLANDDDGLVVGNDTWHYNKIVYDFQITGKSDVSTNLVDTSLSDKFRGTLEKSIFSLCPSGTGPNSIRLWESIGLGSIPVIISDNLALPGNLDLWQEAVVFCPETKQSILALPQQLRDISEDKKLLQKKMDAIKKIWNLYGLENFVCDIVEMITDNPRENLSNRTLPDIHSQVEALCKNLVWLTSEVLLSPERFSEIISDERCRVSIKEAIKEAPEHQKGLFYESLRLAGLNFGGKPSEIESPV